MGLRRPPPRGKRVRARFRARVRVCAGVVSASVVGAVSAACAVGVVVGVVRCGGKRSKCARRPHRLVGLAPPHLERIAPSLHLLGVAGRLARPLPPQRLDQLLPLDQQLL